LQLEEGGFHREGLQASRFLKVFEAFVYPDEGVLHEIVDLGHLADSFDKVAPQDRLKALQKVGASTLVPILGAANLSRIKRGRGHRPGYIEIRTVATTCPKPGAPRRFRPSGAGSPNGRSIRRAVRVLQPGPVQAVLHRLAGSNRRPDWGAEGIGKHRLDV
jgi:hypothetical protein